MKTDKKNRRRFYMKYTTLGNSELKVSRICMGCMGFGDAGAGQHHWTLDESASRAIIRYGLENGINFYDTAIVYQGGTSEQYLGRALRDFVRREDVVVATKFPGRSPEEIEAGISGKDHVRNKLDQSLKNLGMDYVDLYILHMWDYHTPIEETLEGLSDAVKAGKVRAIGISNCYAYQLAKANAIAEREGFPKFVSIQGHYNLLFREEEREMARLCKEDNISMTEVSLAWLLSKVTSPVVGMTKPSHIDGAVKAVELELSEEEVRYLEELYQPHKLVGVMADNH